MRYRRYVPEDFAALYAIEEICFLPPFRFDSEYMFQLVHSANSATWIAEQDGRMTGFAIVERTNASTGREGYIQTIEVLPSERSQGVGGELLARVEDSALAAGCKAIWLHADAVNEGAIRLYQVHGYSFRSRAENYYARGRAALIYRKVLESVRPI